jgi:hypothetical protein
MVIATVSTALAALRTSLDLASSAIAARDEAKLAEATQHLNSRIIDVQNAAMHLQEKQSASRDEIEQLKKDLRVARDQIDELEQRRAERDKYGLHELSPSVFVLAYNRQEDGVPMHYICQTCMDNGGKKEVLQNLKKAGRVLLACPSCENTYFTGETFRYNLNTSLAR